MASLYSGRGAIIGIGQETTYGTANTRTNWLRLASSSLAYNKTLEPRNVLSSGGRAASVRKHYTAAQVVTGTFAVQMSYNACGILLRHLLGAASTSGANPYDHTYVAAAQPTHGLTLEEIRGDGGAQVYTGCVLSSGTLSVEAGGQLMFEGTIIGRGGAKRTTAGTTSVSDEDLILHHHLTSLSFASTTYLVRSLSLTIDNALEPRQQLGSLGTAIPKRSGYLSAALSLTLDVNDDFHDDHLDGTESDAVLTFDGTGTDQMVITVHNARVISESAPINTVGLISQTVELVGQGDGTDDPVSVVVTNGNNSAVAN